jgi:hypothetical protein
MDNDKDLELARKRYLDIFDKLNTKDLEEDTKKAMVALKCIDGLAKIALANKKIESDKVNASENAQALKELVASFSLNNKTAVVDVNKEIPTLPNDLPEPECVPGELDSLNPIV